MASLMFHIEGVNVVNTDNTSCRDFMLFYSPAPGSYSKELEAVVVIEHDSMLDVQQLVKEYPSVYINTVLAERGEFDLMHFFGNPNVHSVLQRIAEEYRKLGIDDYGKVIDQRLVVSRDGKKVVPVTRYKVSA